ncbi:MAG TPA: hypothetical protein VNN98_00270 [Rhizomicrobium sp.]|nr:hypothetical protein [Rhizomicrobium sp.]
MKPGCIRMFKFRVLPGMEQAYADYLRDVVAPIDAVAHDAGAFLELLTVTPDTVDAAWNHGRIFTFRDHAHRGAMPAAMAKAAAAFDGSDEARNKRKAYAETLRRQVVIADYDVG